VTTPAQEKSSADLPAPGDPAAARRARLDEIREADRQATRVAARQWGALSRAQAIKAGLTPDQIAYRVRTGQWHQPVRGVYIVAGAPGRWEQALMAACLAGPAGTVASHLSAAALFGLSRSPEIPQVTVPPKASGRFQGAATFRRRLEPGDACLHRRIPSTTPTRTIVDCAAAGLLDDEALCDLVDSALCKKLTRPPRLVAASARAVATARAHRRRNIERLERALDIWRSGAPADSPPEARLQRRLIEWGFPRAERQIRILDEAGHLVARADVGLRELKVVFEYDSDEHHGPRFWIADDARRDRIEALGWIVVPVDRFDLRPSSTRLRDVLNRIVATRSMGIVPEKRARTLKPTAPRAA
jgi:very-short-patch-repair endonuclease